MILDGITKAFGSEVQGRTRSMAYVVPAVEECIAIWRSKSVGQTIENLDVSADSFRALDVLTTRLSEAVGQQETVACASVIKDAMQSIEELKNSGAVAEQEGVAMRLIEIETRTSH